MEVTIDSLGRILIPKRVRNLLGLAAETKLELKVGQGAIVLEPISVEAELVKTPSGFSVIRGGPPITHEAMERIRHEQYDRRERE